MVFRRDNVVAIKGGENDSPCILRIPREKQQRMMMKRDGGKA